MSRASLSLLSICLALAACTDEPADGLDTWGDPTSTSGTTETTGDGDGDTGTSETDTGETDTGEDEPFDGLRFVASAANSATILAVNLDDPANIPAPELVSSGDGMAGMFGPTPWGAQAVVHGGEIDQLRVKGNGEMLLSRLSLQESPWIEDLWFDEAGTSAIASASAGPLLSPQLLLWMTYDEEGTIVDSFDITPPLQDGSVYVPGRSSDGSHAAIIIDAEPDGVWEIYLLPLAEGPVVAELIDQIDLTGISPIEVPAYLSLHIDDQRIAYRREVNPDVWRPVAVPLDDPESNPVNLVPGFEHSYSVVWSDQGDRMLFTVGGQSGYRELRLADFTGPVDADEAVTLNEPGELALVDSQPPLDRSAPGHGFDAQDRIWYAHQIDPSFETVAISLVTADFDGGIFGRALLTDTPPGAVIGALIWDADTQVLGYRTDLGDTSWLSYIDLSAEHPAAIRIDQDFEYFADEPERNASLDWSADRTRIAVAGIQDGFSRLHVAEVGDPAGATLQLELPLVDEDVDHRPMLSPDGERIMMWFGTPSGQRGLIHATADGSVPGSVAVMVQHQLTAGAFMPHEASE